MSQIQFYREKRGDLPEDAAIVQVSTGDWLPKGTIYLPHSCQQWIIGGKKEAEQLVKDLQKIIHEKEG